MFTFFIITLALELLAHSEDNRDDDVKDVDSVCCGTGSLTKNEEKFKGGDME
jgi:hypothetical protein